MLFRCKKKVRRRFKRRRVIVQGIDYQWEADLADVQNLSEYNNGIRYLLVVVDVFSRFMWVRPLKDKKAQSIVDAFRDILSGPRQLKAIRTDKGSEFYNRYLKRYLQEKGINIFYVLNETKPNFAERYIQTLKKRLYRYFPHTQKHKYINILQDVVMSINETPHRSLNGRAPASVDAENESEVRLDAYLVRRKAQKKRPNIKKSSNRKSTAYSFKIGDQVRISHLRRQF